ESPPEKWAHTEHCEIVGRGQLDPRRSRLAVGGQGRGVRVMAGEIEHWRKRRAELAKLGIGYRGEECVAGRAADAHELGRVGDRKRPEEKSIVDDHSQRALLKEERRRDCWKVRL